MLSTLLLPIVVTVAVLTATPALAAPPTVLPPQAGVETREAWRRPVAPFHIADHTSYVGTEGIAAVLIRTEAGAVIVEGGLPRAVDCVLANLRALGVGPGELEWIVVSHAHFDPAGPIAAIAESAARRSAR